jgi:hypothetical protein
VLNVGAGDSSQQNLRKISAATDNNIFGIEKSHTGGGPIGSKNM